MSHLSKLMRFWSMASWTELILGRGSDDIFATSCSSSVMCSGVMLLAPSLPDSRSGWRETIRLMTGLGLRWVRVKGSSSVRSLYTKMYRIFTQHMVSKTTGRTHVRTGSPSTWECGTLVKKLNATLHYTWLSCTWSNVINLGVCFS